MIGAIPESRPFPPLFGREIVRIFPIDLAGIRKIPGSVTRDDRILPRSRFGRGFRIYPDADLAGGRGFRGSRNPDLAGIDRENPPRPPAGAISKTFGVGGVRNFKVLASASAPDAPRCELCEPRCHCDRRPSRPIESDRAQGAVEVSVGHWQSVISRRLWILPFPAHRPVHRRSGEPELCAARVQPLVPVPTPAGWSPPESGALLGNKLRPRLLFVFTLCFSRRATGPHSQS